MRANVKMRYGTFIDFLSNIANVYSVTLIKIYKNFIVKRVERLIFEKGETLSKNA